MKVKRIYLAGGFGNNLFQINKAYDFKRKGYKVVLNDCLIGGSSITKLLKWSQHPSGLISSICDEFEMESKFRFGDFLSLFVLFLLKKMNVIDIQSYNFSSVTKAQLGYWQSDLILDHDFLHKLKSIYEKHDLSIEPSSSLVVHARLGDFPESIRLSLSYFVEAITSFGVESVILVTDTPDFYRKLKGELKIKAPYVNLRMAPTVNMYEDFLLMVNSNKLVMSNSTFCYWASQIKPVDSVVVPSERRPGIDWYFPLLNSKTSSIKGFN